MHLSIKEFRYTGQVVDVFLNNDWLAQIGYNSIG